MYIKAETSNCWNLRVEALDVEADLEMKKKNGIASVLHSVSILRHLIKIPSASSWILILLKCII